MRNCTEALSFSLSLFNYLDRTVYKITMSDNFSDMFEKQFPSDQPKGIIKKRNNKKK